MTLVADTNVGLRSRPLSGKWAKIETCLAAFEPISLNEMDGVALLNRVDTKYVLRQSQLTAILPRLAAQYRILEIDGTRLNSYRTLYYDTPDFALYLQHHNGVRPRYKVRLREYLGSGLAYWEVKRKTNRGKTVKDRLVAEEFVALEGEVSEFIEAHTPLAARRLEPVLWNLFTRMTLVNTHLAERLTLDFAVGFSWGEHRVALPGIVVAEVKQSQRAQNSDFVRQMRALRIQPVQFSKYCTGVCLLYEGVKANRFKPRLRWLGKLIKEERANGSVD